MEYRKIGDAYVLRLDRGDEVLSSLETFCRAEDVKLGSVEGLGASDHAVIGLYDVEERLYHKSVFDEPMEITSLLGNISTKEGEIYLHLHITLGRAGAGVIGGHLNECRISATGELFVRPLPGTVERRLDETGTGLNLFRFL